MQEKSCFLNHFFLLQSKFFQNLMVRRAADNKDPHKRGLKSMHLKQGVCLSDQISRKCLGIHNFIKLTRVFMISKLFHS